MSKEGNQNIIQSVVEPDIEPSGADFVYDNSNTKKSKEKYKEELESIIRVNQSYDFKSKNSIYKGDTYNEYNKIKDNLPVGLLRYKRNKNLGLENLNKINATIKIPYGVIGILRKFNEIKEGLVEYMEACDTLKISKEINGANSDYVDILHLAKDGFDLDKLENITTNAEIKPLI